MTLYGIKDASVTTTEELHMLTDEPFLVTLRVPIDQAERERWAIALYDLGAVSRSEAAKIAGLTLSAFFKALAQANDAFFAATGHYKTDSSYTAEELHAELEAAHL
jgi:hypothetical protein